MNGTSDIARVLNAGVEESIVHPMHHQTKAKERMYASNKYIQSFNSLSFGSGQIQLSIPRDQVIKGVYANLTFQGTNVADVLAPMPGYNAISRIDYKFGGSTLYTLDGFSLWQVVRSMCSTSDQITELVSLAGGPSNVAIGVSTVQTVVWIPVPYSRLNAAFNKARYGIDSSIMEQPLQIFISLAPAAQVYVTNTGLNSALSAGNWRIYGDSYLHSEDRIVPKDDHLFSFPCFYYQSYVSSSFTPASSSEQQSVQLQGFRKGNLVGMLFSAVDNANYLGNNNFKLNQIQNLQVQFNGVNISYAYGIDSRMIELQASLTPSVYTAYSQVNRVNEIWFSNQPSRFSQFNFMNGLNLSSQTLTCNFTIGNSTNAQKLIVVYIYRSQLCYNSQTAELVL